MIESLFCLAALCMIGILIISGLYIYLRKKSTFDDQDDDEILGI